MGFSWLHLISIANGNNFQLPWGQNRLLGAGQATSVAVCGYCESRAVELLVWSYKSLTVLSVRELGFVYDHPICWNVRHLAWNISCFSARNTDSWDIGLWVPKSLLLLFLLLHSGLFKQLDAVEWTVKMWGTIHIVWHMNAEMTGPASTGDNWFAGEGKGVQFTYCEQGLRLTVHVFYGIFHPRKTYSQVQMAAVMCIWQFTVYKVWQLHA